MSYAWRVITAPQQELREANAVNPETEAIVNVGIGDAGVLSVHVVLPAGSVDEVKRLVDLAVEKLRATGATIP